MQPRPIAETSRLLFPSLRFCMTSPFELSFSWSDRATLLPLRGFARASERAELLPSAKSPDRGISILIPQEVGSLIQLEDRIVGILASRLVARVYMRV